MKRITLSDLRALARQGESVFVTVDMAWELSDPVWEPTVHIRGKDYPVVFDDGGAIRSLSMQALCNLLASADVAYVVLSVDQVARAYRSGPKSEEE